MSNVDLGVAAGAAAAVITLWLMHVYGRVARLKATSDDAWISVGVQYDRRFDLYRDIASAVRAAEGDSDDLERTASARRSVLMAAGAERRIFAENELTDAFSRLLESARRDSRLMDDPHFEKLLACLPCAERDTRLARRRYNAATQIFNDEIERFPSSLIAWLFNFSPSPYFNYSDD